MHLASDYLHPIGSEARGKCCIRIFVPEAHDEERDRAVILCMELGPRKAPPHGRRHPLVHYPRLRRLVRTLRPSHRTTNTVAVSLPLLVLLYAGLFVARFPLSGVM